MLTVINFIGITESVVINMVMAFIEIAGLLIVLFIAIWFIAEGNADFGVLTEFEHRGRQHRRGLAILAGVALSFFAMTGFENTANVAEETIDPHKNFPRALIGGMITAGVIYVLVSMAAALTVPIDTLAESDAALLEVVERPESCRSSTPGLMSTAVLGHRDDRDHQHHAGRGGHPAADPLRHGQRGRRARRVRQDPPDPAQPVGRPALQRVVVVAPCSWWGRTRPRSRGRP